MGKLPCYVTDRGIESEARYTGPFTPTTARDGDPIFAGSYINVSSTTWVPLERTIGGAPFLRKLGDWAKQMSPSECILFSCKIAITSKSDAVGQVVAICDMKEIDGTNGPPTNCGPVAINRGGGWWLRAIASLRWKSIQNLDAMFSVLVAPTSGEIGRAKLLSILDGAIAKDPLRMNSRDVSEGRVLASAPKRFSEILPGNWFEWASVLIEVDSQLSIRVFLDLLVDKQNTDDPSAWHRPLGVQLQRYGETIRGVVNRALEAYCIQPNWIGSTTFQCKEWRGLSSLKQ
jgi:hypothetical protein